LGLEVAAEKTEAIIFHPKKVSEDIPRSIFINGVAIDLASSIKYLGVYIDKDWSLRDHFKYIESKADRVIRALGRLMLILRGPDEKRRRLFANVVYSVILYGAPIWGDELNKSRTRSIFDRLEYNIAQRVISAYRTVSNNAALLLARTPPVQFLTSARKRIYWRIKDCLERGEYSPRIKNVVKEIELATMYD